MITSKEYENIKMGDIIEATNSIYYLVIGVINNRAGYIVYEFANTKFGYLTRKDLDGNKFVKIRNKPLENVQFPNAVMEYGANFMLEATRLFNNKPHEYLQMIKNEKLNKQFIDLLEDENDYEKEVIDVRTSRIYNLIETRNINGNNYVILLRRKLIAKGTMEMEKLYVTIDEFNENYKTVRDDSEETVCINFSTLPDIQFESDQEKSNYNFKYDEKYDEFIEKVLNNNYLPVYREDEINTDKVGIIPFDFETYDFIKTKGFSFMQINENKEIFSKIKDYKNVIKIDNFDKLKEFSEEYSENPNKRYFNYLKEDQTYVLFSPIFDTIKINSINDDDVNCIVRNSIKLITKDDKEVLAMMESEINAKEILLSTILNSYDSIEYVKENNVPFRGNILLNAELLIRQDELYFYDKKEDKFIDYKKENSLDINEFVRYESKNSTGWIYDLRYEPISLLYSDYMKRDLNISLFVSEDYFKLLNNKFLIGKTYCLKNIAHVMFTIKNINSKFIYLELNMPYKKDTEHDIVRLPLKLFKDNFYDFEEFNCLNYYKIFY